MTDTTPAPIGADAAEALAQHAYAAGMGDPLVTAAPAAMAGPDRQALIDVIAQGLSDTWHCLRVWGAWNVGTMSQDDFVPVDESDTPAELADAVLALLSTAPTTQAAPQPAVQQGDSDSACARQVWWTHNKAKFTTTRQSAFAAWDGAVEWRTAAKAKQSASAPAAQGDALGQPIGFIKPDSASPSAKDVPAYDRASVADLMALADTYADTAVSTGIRSGWAQMARAAIEVALMKERAQPTPPAVVEPLTSDQLQHLHHIEEFGLFCDYEEFEQIARAIEHAHGISIKKGGSNG